MKRVLIIAYYWPPAGGSGVQRWVKFSKYLPSQGWQPVIYTPLNPEITSVDETLLADILAMCIACGLSGYLLDVNPFDQPGVEAYKKNMFRILGKPGYTE